MWFGRLVVLIPSTAVELRRGVEVVSLLPLIVRLEWSWWYSCLWDGLKCRLGNFVFMLAGDAGGLNGKYVWTGWH